MSNRDPYFDIVKAVAIIMVVFCHVMVIAPQGTFPQWINNFRVGMNMPIFFIISGYFAWPMVEALDYRKLLKNIRCYLQPAIFAGVLFTVFDCILDSLSFSAFVLKLIRSVFVDPWFITTLIECQLLMFIAWVLVRKVRWMVLIVAIVLCAIMCRPTTISGEKHFASIVSMMPHYLFGAIVLREFDIRIWENRIIGMMCCLAFITFVFLEGNVDINGMSFYTADSSVHAFCSLKSGICFFLRPLVGLIGSIGVMSLIRIAFDYIPMLKKISKIGTLTLGIYIFHLWPLRQLRKVAWVGSSRLNVILTAIVLMFVFSFVTWVLMEKTGRLRKWIWGK